MVRKVVAGFALVAMVLWTGNALGTPGSGVTPSNRVVSSNANINVQSMAGKLLLLEFGSDKAPINIFNVHQTFAPGGYSGWHTHSGPGDRHRGAGNDNDRGDGGMLRGLRQGSVLFEGGPGHIHNASNRTGTPVILDAYFFLPEFDPPGANSRIDEPVQYGDCR